MRPQGVAGALVAIAVGAILTYAVSFTMSGISIHTVGVIIMLVGVVALAILLIRSVGGSRRRSQTLSAPPEQGVGSDGSYLQDPPGGSPQVATTRISTDVYAVPERRRLEEPQNSADAYRASRTPRR
jgi:membrane protein implicated in regulation of membrane protease activity